MGQELDPQGKRLTFMIGNLGLETDDQADAVIYAIEAWGDGDVSALPEKSPDHNTIGRRFPTRAQLLDIANEYQRRRRREIDEKQRRWESDMEKHYPGSVDFLKRHPEHNGRWDAQVEAQWAAERQTHLAEQRTRDEAAQKRYEEQRESDRLAREEAAKLLEEEAKRIEKAKAMREKYGSSDPEMEAILEELFRFA